MEDIEDSTNLTGLGNLINKSHVDEKLDIEALVQSYIGNTKIRTIPVSDPAKEARETLRELQADTGISLGDDNQDDAEAGEENVESVEPEDTQEDTETPDALVGDTVEDTQDEGKTSDDATNPEMEAMFQRLSDRTAPTRPMGRPPVRPITRPAPPRYHQPYAQQCPAAPTGPRGPAPPGSREEHLDEALRAYSGYDKEIDVDRENDEDTKGILLEDIDELRNELDSNGQNIQRIPEVTSDSSLDDIKKVHNILRRKYDRNRCNSFGTELILATAQGLEYAFDGKRKWGPYSPDLTGWHNTIRPKLRRMRYETSTIVSGIMQEYNIGPTARILLELVPSAFLYSKMRKEQHGKANYSPDAMSEAYDDLRQFD